MENECISSEQMASLIDGSISVVEKAALLAHIVGCASCYDEYLNLLEIFGEDSNMETSDADNDFDDHADEHHDTGTHHQHNDEDGQHHHDKHTEAGHHDESDSDHNASDDHGIHNHWDDDINNHGDHDHNDQ